MAALLLAAGPAAGQDGEATVRWRMASLYNRDLPILGSHGHRLDRLVKEISDGAVQIRFYEPGTLAPTLEVLDRLADGRLDAAWSTSGYWGVRIPAMALLGGAPFGLGPQQHAAWLTHGGGRELLEQAYQPLNIHPIPCGMVGPEAAGWFRAELAGRTDLDGLRMRMFGPGAGVLERLGATTVLLAGADIFPALSNGTIDAVEVFTPAIDAQLGVQEVAPVYHYPGWHQPATPMELLINRDRWGRAREPHRRLIEAACADTLMAGLQESLAATPRALDTLVEQGVRIEPLPADVLAALREAWREEAAAMGDADATGLFRAVLRSQQAFAETHDRWAGFGPGWPPAPGDQAPAAPGADSGPAGN